MSQSRNQIQKPGCLNR